MTERRDGEYQTPHLYNPLKEPILAPFFRYQSRFLGTPTSGPDSVGLGVPVGSWDRSDLLAIAEWGAVTNGSESLRFGCGPAAWPRGCEGYR